MKNLSDKPTIFSNPLLKAFIGDSESFMFFEMLSKPLEIPATASAITCQTAPLKFKLTVPSFSKKSFIAPLPLSKDSTTCPKVILTTFANRPRGPMVITLMLSFIHLTPSATFSNALATKSPNLVIVPVTFSLPNASRTFVIPVVTVASKLPIAPSKVLVERAASSAASVEPRS